MMSYRVMRLPFTRISPPISCSTSGSGTLSFSGSMSLLPYPHSTPPRPGLPALRSAAAFRYADRQHPRSQPMPNITVNAEPKTLPDPLTVADLLRHLGKDPHKL